MVKPGSIPGVVFVQLVHRIHFDVGNYVFFTGLKIVYAEISQFVIEWVKKTQPVIKESIHP